MSEPTCLRQLAATQAGLAKMNTETELAMGLYFLRHAPDMQDLSDFGLAEANESLTHVLHCIQLGLKKEIKFPDRNMQAQLRSLHAWPPFDTAIGAVDGTYTPKTRAKGFLSGHRGLPCCNSQMVVDVTGK